MQIKKILITGDDGYNSIGTRLLIYFLKDKYQLKIASTKNQQSGVGGKLTFKKNIKWNKINFDGIETIWVNATPCDAIDFAWTYFREKFDLVISGLNLGANISNGIISSGTWAAGFRAINLGLADKVIVLSWNCPTGDWFREGCVDAELKKYIDWPGKAVNKIINEVLVNNFWGNKILNINLPKNPTNKVRFTKFISDIDEFYSCEVKINEKNGYYIHPCKIKKNNNNITTDAGAIQKGFISITPCVSGFLEKQEYKKMKNKKFQI